MDDIPQTSLGQRPARARATRSDQRDGAPLQGAVRRGPTKARSNYAGPDTLLATIENSLTAAERNLLEFDEHQRVREIRVFFQHASERDFVETVEQITGRKVRAFVSGVDTRPDVSSGVFYFETVAAAS
jgi:uncharacterized protein YbcI